MRVAVVSAAVPFVRGGAEMLEEGLVHHLRERGVDVAHVRIPFAWDTPLSVRRTMAAASSFDLPRVDRVIPVKFPGWLVSHPHVVPWVFHQFRQVYDMWESGLSGWNQDDRAAIELKALVTRVDREVFQGCERVFTYSPTNSERLTRFNGICPTLLYSPMPLSTAYRSGPFDDYVLALGRVCGSKRQHLAVEALSHTSNPVRLVIAGVADPPQYGDELSSLITRLGLGDRVDYIDRFITEDEKASLLEHALASVYIPIDEDNFGYVTGESFLAERPVVTLTDSGGVCWVVHDRRTGLVAEPEPASLAQAFDELFENRAFARDLGIAGRAHLDEMKLDWDHAVDVLLA